MKSLIVVGARPGRPPAPIRCPVPRRTVILRHNLPDGAWHRDWLLEMPDAGVDPDARTLHAFRIGPEAASPDDPAAREFLAEPMPPHRRAYLDFEGPLSGDRGAVRRIASGRIEWASDRDGLLVVSVDWGRGPAVWTGRRSADALWLWRRSGPGL
jgi:hypothetical protein